jgi:hypothetical protein
MRLLILSVLLLVGCGQDRTDLPDRASLPPPTVAVQRVPTLKIVEKHSKDILDRMSRANMIFSVPAKTNIDQPIIAELDIDPVRSLDEMERQLRGRLPADRANIAVSKIMEAHLTSADFRVQSITPERQPLSQRDNTVWTWQLDTDHGGLHQVSVAVNAVVSVDGERVERTVKVYEHSIMVEVTPRQHVVRFISNNWQWLWGVIFMPLVIAGWRWLQHHRPNQDS